MALCGFGLASRLVPTDIPYYTKHSGFKIVSIALIVISQIVLAPEVVRRHLADNMHVLERNNPCTLERQNDFLAHIDRVFERHAHVAAARRETWLMVDFQRRLRHDVGLYGVSGYRCRSKYGVPETVAEWNRKQSKPFFTEWCVAEMKAMMEAEGKKMCRVEQPCICAKAVWGGCLPTWLAPGYCPPPYQVPCGQDVGGMGLRLAGHQKSLAQLRDEKRSAQEAAAKASAQAQGGLGALKDQALRYAWIVDEFEASVSTAALIYSGYEILVLLAVTPLTVFVEPLSVKVQKGVLGIPKYAFIPVVACIVMVAGYASTLALELRWLPHYFAITNVLPTVYVEPCFLDPRFVQQVASRVVDMCQELAALEANYTRALSEIPSTLREVHLFSTGERPCDCRLPLSELREFPRTWSLDASRWVSDANFTRAMNTERLSTLLVPNETAAFPGSGEICRSPTLLLEALIPNLEVPSLVAMLLRSAVLSTLLAQFLLTKVILSLLKLVDPLCVHGGQYLAPVETFNEQPFVMAWRTKLSIVELLRAEAFSACVVYGVPLLVVFANLVWAFSDDAFKCRARLLSRDSAIGLLEVAVAIAMLCVTPVALHCLKRRFMLRSGPDGGSFYSLLKDQDVECTLGTPVTICNACNPSERLEACSCTLKVASAGASPDPAELEAGGASTQAVASEGASTGPAEPLQGTTAGASAGLEVLEDSSASMSQVAGTGASAGPAEPLQVASAGASASPAELEASGVSTSQVAGAGASAGASSSGGQLWTFANARDTLKSCAGRVSASQIAVCAGPGRGAHLGEARDHLQRLLGAAGTATSQVASAGTRTSPAGRLAGASASPAELGTCKVTSAGASASSAQLWTFTDSGDARVFINSAFGQRLADHEGAVVLAAEDDDCEEQKWTLTAARSGAVFINSHRDQQLSARRQQVLMHKHISGACDQWIIKSREGEAAVEPARHGLMGPWWWLLPAIGLAFCIALFCLPSLHQWDVVSMGASAIANGTAWMDDLVNASSPRMHQHLVSAWTVNETAWCEYALEAGAH